MRLTDYFTVVDLDYNCMCEKCYSLVLIDEESMNEHLQVYHHFKRNLEL